MARLRGPGGCPWDREQSHASLKKYAVEETYELIDAIDSGDDLKILEELGDVLLQVVFHAQMASERGAFDINDVIKTLTAKLIERHPHVFGDTQAHTAEEVLDQWEARKIKKGDRKHALEGVPKSLPALLMTHRIAEKLRAATETDPRITAANAGEILRQTALAVTALGLDPEEELRRRNEHWIAQC